MKESIALDLFYWLQALMFALIAIVLLFTFIGRVIGVIGVSMEPTLHPGEFVLLQTIAYEPEQNDVVVILHRAFSEEPIIKRVIALEGQSVDIDYDRNEVYVDGALIDEPYINYDDDDPLDTGTGVHHYEVPEGHVFVMGDNRDHSADSRSTAISYIDKREILGRAHAVILPLGDLRSLHF